MSDPFPPNSNSPAPRGKGPADNSERELDEILARAASLANDLGNEIGAIPTDAEPTGPASGDRRLDSRELNLDTELDELDRLVASAAGDLAADNAAGANAPPPATGDLPDFMREFMQPASTSLAFSEPMPPQDSTRSPSAFNQSQIDDDVPHVGRSITGGSAKLSLPSKPGVVGTGMLGVVGTPALDPIEAVPSDAATVPASGENRFGPPTTRNAAPAVLSRIGCSACDVAIRVLEKFDRPLASMGMGLRRLAGWFALATLATALIVYTIALFEK